MAQNPYDLVPYTTFPFAETHPDRLHTIAKIHGLETALPSECRVLELGCATGGNLIPMATQYPNSQFFGIDLSEKQIDTANAIKDSLQLKNIHFKSENLLNLSADLGKFDFIICHGVYSWVPREVQEKIFSICRNMMAENGVSYISFNTYPGWLSRRMARDFMKFHAAQFSDPDGRVRESKKFFKSVVDSTSHKHNSYFASLSSEWNQIQNKSDDYIVHEYLEDNNEPEYFHEFHSRAESKGLKYLRDARYGLSSQSFSYEARQFFETLPKNRVLREQYADIFLNRVFRRALLVQKEVEISEFPKSDILATLYLSTRAHAQTSSGGQISFQHPKFGVYSPKHPVTAKLLDLVAGLFPRAASIDDLRPKIVLQAEEEKTVYDDLLDAFDSGILELQCEPSRWINKISLSPKVSSWARYQALNSEHVTNGRHEIIGLTPDSKRLIPLLDGKSDRVQLLEKLGISSDLELEIALTELQKNALLVG